MNRNLLFKYLIFIGLFGVVVKNEKARACSAVSGVYFWGSNFDWGPRKGLIFQSPRNQVKTAHLAEMNGLTWVSKYRSITMSQFGRDYPMHGINEKGLSGAVLIGPADYPRGGFMGTITENLWLQFQLDRYVTIDQVEQHAQDLAIQKVSANLHLFMCDAENQCAVIEFHNGRAVVYKGASLPVKALTNTSYEFSLNQFKEWQQSFLPGQTPSNSQINAQINSQLNSPLPQGYNPVARFIRLGQFLKSDLFGADKQSLVDSLANVASNALTSWQTIFDTSNKTLTFHLGHQLDDLAAWSEVGFANGRFPECGENLEMMDISEGAHWKPYDKNLVRQIFAESARGAAGLGFEIMESILRHSELVRCDFSAETR
jgi:choloylglycine hydrolase